MYCTDRIEDILLDRAYAEEQIFNLYGGKGVGKTHLTAQLLEERRKAGRPCGYLDFDEYRGMSPQATLNALYQICDYLTIKHNIALPQFEIADEVNCERWGKIPYCQRKKNVVCSTIDQTSDISELVVDVISEFRDLPYIGLGIRLLQRASKLAYSVYHTHSPAYLAHKSFREKCQNMSDMELLRQLPISLANDVEQSAAAPKANRAILVVVDNYNEAQIDNSWLDTLISNTRHVTWVFVSRSPIRYANGHVVPVPVAPLDKEQLKCYLERQHYPYNDTLLDCLMNTSGGIPLRIERMLEYAARKGQCSPSDWEQIQALGYQHIALELLHNLSVNEKEILFQVNFAQSFDEELFSRMFPGRLFSLYHSWFQSALFSEDEHGRFKVQGAMKEEITAYMLRMGGDSLVETCKKNLYLAEYSWFRDFDRTSKCPMAQCDYHLRNLLAYGMELPSADQCARDLLSISRTLLELGYTTEYCEALSRLSGQVSAPIRIDIFQEMAILYLRISKFSESRTAINQGMELLGPHDPERWITFSLILMELEYISPSETPDAVRHCIEIAENLIQVLEANIDHIPYKHYINSMVKAHLYLAKTYIIKNDYSRGMQHASYVLELCSDTKKCSALALHANHAKAQEYMGEIKAMEEEWSAALSYYRSAAENYQLAEAVQLYWDAAFYLDFGLIYKRLGEASLSLAKRQTSLDKKLAFEKAAQADMDHALKKYGEVCRQRPELIDAYCKIGFLYNMFLEYFWDRDDHQAAVERYFEQAHDNLQAALQIVGLNHANRQLANISCTLTCMHGRYLAYRGEDAKAEQAFCQSIQYGRAAVSMAPGHPYGYLVLSECCLALGKFFADRERIREASEVLEEGLSHIRTAERYAGNTNRHFQTIQVEILQYLEQLTAHASV